MLKHIGTPLQITLLGTRKTNFKTIWLAINRLGQGYTINMAYQLHSVNVATGEMSLIRSYTGGDAILTTAGSTKMIFFFFFT